MRGNLKNIFVDKDNITGWKIIISIITIDLPEEEEHIVGAVELEWAEMPVNLDLHIRTLKSNS